MGAVVALGALVFSAPSSANLSQSSFEGNDGNLSVDTTGNKDWVNVAGRNTGIDDPSGTTDNSFGQGTKEDDPNVTIVAGSIPPNKSDLTRFYEASEHSGTKDFLYLAWERTKDLGSANMDFEISKHQYTQNEWNGSTLGKITLQRTAGDLLVTYDFGGSGAPTLGILKWLTAGNGDSVADCFSANALPCWGKQTTLNGGNSEGAVNSGTVTEPITSTSLAAHTFGEAAINLTDAGIFSPGVCTAFGSAFLKSRSSASFTAEVKDFIAPIPVNITNCGTITINKVTAPASAPADTFPFSATGGLSPSSFTLANGGTRTYSSQQPGTFTVTEGAMPSANWSLTGLACGTVTGTGTIANVSGNAVSITLAAGGNVDCTFTNTYTKNSPTITTSLTPSTVGVGGSVHDSATLSGATSGAGGTVTYTVYDNNTCTGTGTAAGTKGVSGGIVDDSDAVTFNAAGDYYWKAVYSGDGSNNGAVSACTDEHLVVTPAHPSAATTQTLRPNDSFTLSGGFNPTGSISFKLFDPSDTTCSGTPAYSATATVNGNGTYSTTNTTFFATTAGTWRWLDSYTGDTNNDPATSACGTESFTINNG